MQIPLEDFFKNPEKTAYKISPDGYNISWLADYQGRMNIYIQATSGGEVKRLTSITERDLRSYFWLNNFHLAFFKDNNGDENDHFYVVPINGEIVQDLTPFENVKVELVDELEDNENEVLIMMNKRDPVLFDVYRLKTDTGEITLVEENPGNITGWITDHEGNIKLAITTDGVNTSLLYRNDHTLPFQSILTTNFKEGVSPLFFDFDNDQFYALSNLNRDKVAIVKFDPKTATETEIIFEHQDVDADSMGFSKKRKVLTVGVFTTWKQEFIFFDRVTEQRYKRLSELIKEDAEIFIVAKNKGENIFVIRTISDISLGNYYLYDEQNDNVKHLANVSPWLNSADLCEMQPIQYKSADGLTIHGYLTLPNNTKAQNLPVIVNPHGGPWVRDTWRFNPEVQFLANRGFAVLQMNYRGSTGYGKKFMEAGFKQWGKKMQDDISDGVKYLISEGIADKTKVGIYGASYGGYATLAGLTFSPDLYACGVDYVGVSNLFSFMETIPPYWKPYLEMMYEMVGHPENDKELLASSTPLFHIDKIKAPLFVAQGAMDPRVKKSESDQIVNALREKNIEVEYMVKDNEGHGFSNAENRFEFYTAMEKFMGTHLLKK